MPAEVNAAAAAFSKEAGVDLDADAADECERVCAASAVAPADLFYKWEAYAIAHGRGDGAPRAADLAALGAELARTHAAAARRRGGKPVSTGGGGLVRRAAGVPPVMNVDDFFSYVDGVDAVVPAARVEADDRFGAAGGGGGGGGEAMVGETAAGVSASPDTRRASIIVGGAALGGEVEDVALPGDEEDAVGAVFADRQGAGKVVSTFNGGPASSSAGVAPVRVDVLPQYANVSTENPFTYMNDGLEGVADSVRARLRAVGERILARRAAGLEGGEDAARPPAAAAFFSASPNVVLAVGRVRVELDGDAGVGRINPSSVVLEGEDGNMVKLNLARINAARHPLFLSPGMIVVAEGINTNGRVLDVHAVYDNSIPLRAGDAGTAATGRPPPPVARVVVAAGPFTLPGNLKYEPLDALLSTVLASKPDVVVLLGPFVDAAHKLVGEGLPVDFESLFESRVVKRISDAAARSPATSFVLVPALGDVHHEHVCPQPPFRIRGGDAGTSVHFVSNPCAITVANAANTRAAVLGVTSLPAMLDLSADSLCADTGDRVRSLASHIVRQWSFYPPFPATPGVPMDASHGARLELPDCGIDALVTPSVLQPFVKAADGDVVAVNPGMLVRGAAGGGAYAELAVPLHRNAVDLVKPEGAHLNTTSLSAEIYRL